MSAPITYAACSGITYAAIGINYNTAAKANSASYGLTQGYSQTGLKIHSAAASYGLTQGYSQTGLVTISSSASYGLSKGYTAAAGLQFAESITFALTNDYTPIGNVSFGAVSITFAQNFSETAIDGFLWNDVTDPSTSYATVADPSTTWTETSDQGTSWSDVYYPN